MYKYNLSIPGWMKPADLNVLSLLASSSPDNGKLLEIGAWCGRSTTALWNNKPLNSTLDVVDSFKYMLEYHDAFNKSLDGSHDMLHDALKLAKYSNSWASAFKYCVGHEMYAGLKLHVKTSGEFEITQDYDLIFIDADHTEDAVYNDIMKFSVNKNALLVGDDAAPRHPGVMNALLRTNLLLKRTVILPKGTKLWIMVPNTGYWATTFPEIYSKL